MAEGILSKVTNIGELLDLGGDALLSLFSELIEAIGQGTEWTGEQIDRLGELEQSFAAAVAALKGE